MSQRIQSYRLNGVNTVNGFGLPFTGVNYNVTLAANTPQTFTIPSFLPEGGGLTYASPTYFVVFGVGHSGADVYAAYNDTAVLPTGSITLSTSGAISDGEGKFVFAGDSISLIASNAINVSMKFYFKG